MYIIVYTNLYIIALLHGDRERISTTKLVIGICDTVGLSSFLLLLLLLVMDAALEDDARRPTLMEKGEALVARENAARTGEDALLARKGANGGAGVGVEAPGVVAETRSLIGEI